MSHLAEEQLLLALTDHRGLRCRVAAAAHRATSPRQGAPARATTPVAGTRGSGRHLCLMSPLPLPPRAEPRRGAAAAACSAPEPRPRRAGRARPCSLLKARSSAQPRSCCWRGHGELRAAQHRGQDAHPGAGHVEGTGMRPRGLAA